MGEDVKKYIQEGIHFSNEFMDMIEDISRKYQEHIFVSMEIGHFDKMGKIIMKLSDGTMTELIIGKSDYGDSDYDRGTTTYSSYCVLEESDINSLKSSNIEKVRIYWSKGYDDYECDNPDVINKQLNCLK